MKHSTNLDLIRSQTTSRTPRLRRAVAGVAAATMLTGAGLTAAAGAANALPPGGTCQLHAQYDNLADQASAEASSLLATYEQDYANDPDSAATAIALDNYQTTKREGNWYAWLASTFPC